MKRYQKLVNRYIVAMTSGKSALGDEIMLQLTKHAERFSPDPKAAIAMWVHDACVKRGVEPMRIQEPPTGRFYR